jgi:hypothetical protein
MYPKGPASYTTPLPRPVVVLRRGANSSTSLPKVSTHSDHPVIDLARPLIPFEVHVNSRGFALLSASCRSSFYCTGGGCRLQDKCIHMSGCCNIQQPDNTMASTYAQRYLLGNLARISFTASLAKAWSLSLDCLRSTLVFAQPRHSSTLFLGSMKSITRVPLDACPG